MIKETHQERMHTPVPDTRKTLNPKAQCKIPARQGVSQYVLETARRLKEEYQADLDYLEKH